MPQNCLKLSASAPSNYLKLVTFYVTMDIFYSDVAMATDFSLMQRYQMLSLLPNLVQIYTSIKQL